MIALWVIFIFTSSACLWRYNFFVMKGNFVTAVKKDVLATQFILGVCFKVLQLLFAILKNWFVSRPFMGAIRRHWSKAIYAVQNFNQIAKPQGNFTEDALPLLENPEN